MSRAGLLSGTHPTYGFSLHLSSLPLLFAFKGWRRKEKIGVVPTTQSNQLPIVHVGNVLPVLATTR